MSAHTHSRHQNRLLNIAEAVDAHIGAQDASTRACWSSRIPENPGSSVKRTR
jgi:hypothetical protein